MQIDKTTNPPTIYAACSPKTPHEQGEEITLMNDHQGYAVDYWRANGDNHWNRHFRELSKALDEYNRWASVQETMPDLT